ncbi:MAG: VWA domain-containing protein [Candidatus Lokiarchaeota archaeon]|nr:VWA domain-containing protein [Candidatus Lokiarchaeota archaeon]
MEDIKIEDTVLLIDSSRSMLRSDFKPNRITIALKMASNFILNKFQIDPKDRISILNFGKTTHKLSHFTNNAELLNNALKKINISGNGVLHNAISFALQILVEEMRKIGGKIPRIMIISDNKFESSEKIDKIVNIAKGLGIFIDACQIGITQDFKNNILKRISRITGGEFGFFNNSKAIINAGKAFASKKSLKKTSDYFSPNKSKDIPPLLNEISLPLRRPTIMEIRLMMSNQGIGQEKCQICHSIKAPLTTADFFSEGRYCPSCDRSMHLSCAALWARKSEYKNNVFRCPFCYFLLRVPKSIVKIIGDHEEKSQKIKIIDESKSKTTKMLFVIEEKVTQIDASCSYCHSIFLGDYEVFQCEKCGSYYHKPCLEKMFKEIKACRYCGSQIIFEK